MTTPLDHTPEAERTLARVYNEILGWPLPSLEANQSPILNQSNKAANEENWFASWGGNLPFLSDVCVEFCWGEMND